MSLNISAFIIAFGLIGLLVVAVGIVAVLLVLVNRKSGERCPKCDGTIEFDAQDCPACGTPIARAPVKPAA